jgi:hypothetical protein
MTALYRSVVTGDETYLVLRFLEASDISSSEICSCWAPRRWGMRTQQGWWCWNVFSPDTIYLFLWRLWSCWRGCREQLAAVDMQKFAWTIPKCWWPKTGHCYTTLSPLPSYYSLLQVTESFTSKKHGSVSLCCWLDEMMDYFSPIRKVCKDLKLVRLLKHCILSAIVVFELRESFRRVLQIAAHKQSQALDPLMRIFQLLTLKPFCFSGYFRWLWSVVISLWYNGGMTTPIAWSIRNPKHLCLSNSKHY